MLKRGTPPYLECSTKGDKRFSAFCAKIRSRGNRSIEEIYQGAKIFEDGSTGLSWRSAKGRKPINYNEVKKLYDKLWMEYLLENQELIPVLLNACGLSDMFGKEENVCQADTLWRFKNWYCNAPEEILLKHGFVISL